MGTIFISHSTADKPVFVRPLADLLRLKGFDVWLDESELHFSADLRKEITSIVDSCEIAIVVISRSYLSSKWTMYELESLFKREERERKRIIFPVWHHISDREALQAIPKLAGRLVVHSSESPEMVVWRLHFALGLDPSGPKSSPATETNTILSAARRKLDSLKPDVYLVQVRSNSNTVWLVPCQRIQGKPDPIGEPVIRVGSLEDAHRFLNSEYGYPDSRILVEVPCVKGDIVLFPKIDSNIVKNLEDYGTPTYPLPPDAIIHVHRFGLKIESSSAPGLNEDNNWMKPVGREQDPIRRMCASLMAWYLVSSDQLIVHLEPSGVLASMFKNPIRIRYSYFLESWPKYQGWRLGYLQLDGM